MCSSFVVHLCLIFDCLRKKCQIRLIHNRHITWNITYQAAIDIGFGKQDFFILCDCLNIRIDILIRIDFYSISCQICTDFF